MEPTSGGTKVDEAIEARGVFGVNGGKTSPASGKKIEEA